MGKITLVLSDEIEDRLRNLIRKRGDLSKIVEQALKELLDRREGKTDG